MVYPLRLCSFFGKSKNPKTDSDASRLAGADETTKSVPAPPFSDLWGDSRFFRFFVFGESAPRIGIRGGSDTGIL